MVSISTDKNQIDINFVHSYLSTESYWAKGIPLETVKESINNSLCFSVIKDNCQIGFARVITDQATFAYLCDVFIIESERGQGYSKQLMKYIIEYPSLQGLRRWMLATADAHSLYTQFGFNQLSNPERIMTITNQNMYKSN